MSAATPEPVSTPTLTGAPHASWQEIQAALTEWHRRWKEQPERFMSEADCLAEPDAEYGEGAAKHLHQILTELFPGRSFDHAVSPGR